MGDPLVGYILNIMLALRADEIRSGRQIVRGALKGKPDISI